MLRIINLEGIFLRDDFNFDEEKEIGLDVPPAQGLYLPKWNGENWIEGMSQEQIEKLKNQPVELTPEQQELQMLKKRLDETENALLETLDFILMGGM